MSFLQRIKFQADRRLLSYSWWWILFAGLIPAWADDQKPPHATLTEKINHRIRESWAKNNVQPAPAASDAEFLRRVSLDLAGKIPAPAEIREFLADPTPAALKRQKLVDKLLESPRYIVHFSNLWREELLPELSSDPQLQFLMPSFNAWLRDQLIDNDSYADLVRELVTMPIAPSAEMNRGIIEEGNRVSPVAFYQAKGGKPENLASGVARVFLGVRIECAQCHNHPFDHWKQEEFWSFAAFFAGVSRQQNGDFGGPLMFSGKKRSLSIPEKDKVVEARFLSGQSPDWGSHEDGRALLAEWLVRPDNPYFARAAVNRLWGRLIGVGIVEPIDDFSEQNLPSHPDLLDEMAQDFAAHNYDLKYLLRAIIASEAYQLSSRQTHPSQEDPRLFAKMALKGMTFDQLFDSLTEATGFFERNRGGRGTIFPDDETLPRAQFQQLFGGENDGLVDRTTSILQALAMMNSPFIAQQTGPQGTGTLQAILELPGLSTNERVEALYLAVLSRPPTAKEIERIQIHLQGKEEPQALRDLFWALLNSSEFLFNH